MDRRSYLETAGAAAVTGLFAGCSGGGSESGSSDGSDGDSDGSDSETTYGILSTSVTDQPTDIGDFESCVVTLQGLWIKPAGDEGEEDATAEETATTESTTTETATETTESTDEETEEGDDSETDAEEEDGDNGRRYIEFEEEQSADLVELQGSNTQLIEETEVETGEYKFLQLDVTGIEGTLEDGSQAEIETPGNAPLKFNAAFEIRAEERTQFIADFTPVKRGNGSYIIQPVASGTTVLYGDEEYQGGDSDGGETESGTETETESGAETDDGGNETSGQGGNRTNGGGN